MTERMVQVATRVLYVLVTVSAILTLVLALALEGNLDGKDHVYMFGPSHEDFFALTIYMAIVLLVGGLVAQRPTPARAAVWVVTSLVTSIVYYVFVDPRSLWSRPFDAVLITTTFLVVGGSVLAAFALRAAKIPPNTSEPVRTHCVRALVRVMIGVAAIVIVAGFLPGVAVYGDSNNCFGNALSSFGGHGGHHDCHASYTSLEEVRSAGNPFLAMFLVVILAPMFIIYRDSTRIRAWLWVLWIVVALVGSAFFAIFGDFHLDLFSRTKTLWPGLVVFFGLGVLGVLFAIVLPVVLASAREDKVPAARVV